MLPINNSDLAWLVVSDYNQDNNIGFPNELREDVYDPEVNHFNYDFDYDLGKIVGGQSHRIGGGGGVGDLSSREGTITAGTFIGHQVGWTDAGIGGNTYGSLIQHGGTVGDTK